jgi:hypothetical protein
LKHAGPEAIRALESLLKDLRTLEGIKERTPGTFYRRSKAFLHFHEDPAGLFADVRLAADGDFSRMRVSTAAERQRFMTLVRTSLK